ncbi:MAG TPA: GTP-binding protein [Propionicimonas sp.]|jgi:sulfate adenylyltransferase subunit 1|uniref:sulfate adenylyltransferase subunit 1 n=1 Tax=Propionicimonas sp. TaxID=1955623 RepID=UPI002F4042C9
MAARDNTSLLRLATAGSVDDGKSTLVGRLLHDSKSVLADQLAAVTRVSKDKGLGHVDLALLTDGLRSEREQGITIDVAYRYFATPRRTFILADCPGHVQYTRNTVTGSSTADALVLLVDVRKGVLEQTRRHLAVAALLRVPSVVIAINKVDLIDYDGEAYARIAQELAAIATGLGITDVHTLPVSALVGDNIVDRSGRMPWYDGPSLLELLEELPVASDPGVGFRFPVQLTLRPQEAARDARYREYRGYAGRVSSGSAHVGQEVVVLPEGVHTHIAGIDFAGVELAEAVTGASISLRLADDVDVARGELISSVADAPAPVTELDAMVCWLADRPLLPGARVLVKHGTRTVQARVGEIVAKLDLDLMAPEEADQLALNDIGRVRVRLASPVLAEDYTVTRHGGSFLMIDPQTQGTLAAGMIRGHEVFGNDFTADGWSI